MSIINKISSLRVNNVYLLNVFILRLIYFKKVVFGLNIDFFKLLENKIAEKILVVIKKNRIFAPHLEKCTLVRV